MAQPAHTHTSPSFVPVEQFNCPGCGNALDVISPRAKYTGCPYCGSLLDAGSPEHRILAQLGDPGQFAPFSFIRLGLYAEFDGQRYQVIARTRWRMDYKEFWEEDGEKGYSDEIWHYDEWLLLGEDRTYFYLVEDAEGYWRSEEYLPSAPALLDGNPGPRPRLSFEKGLKARTVQEYGEAQALFFEGESNYTLRQGDRIRFASYRHDDAEYLYEARHGSDGELSEVEFFKETRLPNGEVLAAFQQNGEVAELLVQRQAYFHRAGILLAGAIVGLLLSIYSLSKSLEMVHQEAFVTSATDSAMLVGQPFDLEKGVYRLSLSLGDLPANTDLFAVAFISDAEARPVNRVQGYFYNYTGEDEDGVYTESELSHSKLLRVDEAGRYQLNVLTQGALADGARLVLRLEKGIWLTRYFVVFTLLAAFLAFYQWYAGHKIR